MRDQDEQGTTSIEQRPDLRQPWRAPKIVSLQPVIDTEGPAGIGADAGSNAP